MSLFTMFAKKEKNGSRKDPRLVVSRVGNARWSPFAHVRDYWDWKKLEYSPFSGELYDYRRSKENPFCHSRPNPDYDKFMDGLCCATGFTGGVDMRKAHEYWESSTYPGAKRELARCYYYGIGFSIDTEKAKMMLREVIEGGDLKEWQRGSISGKDFFWSVFNSDHSNVAYGNDSVAAHMLNVWNGMTTFEYEPVKPSRCSKGFPYVTQGEIVPVDLLRTKGKLDCSFTIDYECFMRDLQLIRSQHRNASDAEIFDLSYANARRQLNSYVPAEFRRGCDRLYVLADTYNYGPAWRLLSEMFQVNEFVVKAEAFHAKAVDAGC